MSGEASALETQCVAPMLFRKTEKEVQGAVRLVARAMAALLMIVAAASSDAQRSPLPTVRRLVIRVENPVGIHRESETVAVAWRAVQERLPRARANLVRVLEADGREIASQVIDSDADGRPDELIFQSDFPPGEARTFVVEPAAPAKAQPRVHIRHDEPRDDVAWENDRVAFRIYGEGLKKTPSAMSSSGIDVWPKRVRSLILEKWYAKGHDSYHIDTGEGADFFDVGETLGAGGTAIWRNDTIYRADNFKAYKIIANGPIRAIFELRYSPWDAGGVSVSEIKRISIDAGHNLYRSESVFSSPGDGDIPYAIGLVKRPAMRGTVSRDLTWAWLTGWGRMAPKNGGHGELGTAVLLPRERLRDWKEVHNHYLGVSHAKSGQPVVHYVGAGWTASGDFPNPQSWWEYLDNYAKRLAAPLVVKVDENTRQSAGRPPAPPTRDGRVAEEADWKDQPAGTVEELFIGRFPGVEVYRSSTGLSVRIRGRTSVLGGNEPLYVLDGVPVGGLDGINPGDVARIEVLKDAGATAAYGVRGANGVILITTKRSP